MRNRLAIAVLLALAIIGGPTSIGAAPPPRAIMLSSDRFTALVLLKSYLAWRIDVPTGGFVTVHPLGVQTGSGIFMFTDEGSVGGGVSMMNAGANGVGVHGEPHVDTGYAGVMLQPGVHRVIVIIGGGTVPANVETLRLEAPAGSTVLNVTSGPAVDLADSNFTSDGGLVARSPVASFASIHGSVRQRIKNRLVGWFVGNPQTTTVSFTDPSGSTRVAPPHGWVWFDDSPGTYTLRVDEEMPPTLNPSYGVRAVLADVRMP